MLAVAIAWLALKEYQPHRTNEASFRVPMRAVPRLAAAEGPSSSVNVTCTGTISNSFRELATAYKARSISFVGEYFSEVGPEKRATTIKFVSDGRYKRTTHTARKMA